MNTNAQKTSTLAIVALVLAVICAPIGVILGIIALVRINDSRGQLGGKGLAIAAIVAPLAMIPVIGILAAIAIPNFIRYQLRSKTSEARVVLGGLRTSEESFRATSDQYVRVASNPGSKPATTKTAWEVRPCSPKCSPENASACTEFSCIGYESPGLVYYRYACETTPGTRETPPEFTCAAVGDLDGDGEYGAFVFGTANAKGASTIRAPVPEIAAKLCLGEIPAGEVHDCRMGHF